MSAKLLEGRTALVTGGSRGIGRAIARGLAGAGAHVCLTYRNSHELANAAVDEIASAGGRAFAVRMDTSIRASVLHAFREIEESWPRLDILINNAGINKPTDFDQITDEDWDHILAVNLKGPFIVTQTFWPLMIKAGSASIVNIGSVSGQYGGPRTAHYAASKAGLISLSEVIARFGAKHGIRCSVESTGGSTDAARIFFMKRRCARS